MKHAVQSFRTNAFGAFRSVGRAFFGSTRRVIARDAALNAIVVNVTRGNVRRTAKYVDERCTGFLLVSGHPDRSGVTWRGDPNRVVDIRLVEKWQDVK